jgi:hypothetical protein
MLPLCLGVCIRSDFIVGAARTVQNTQLGVKYETLPHILFYCILFNVVVSNSDYTASNNRMSNGSWIGKEGSSYGIIKYILSRVCGDYIRRVMD